jgi:hypothetical protein
MPHATDGALISPQFPDDPVFLNITDHLLSLRKRVVHRLVAGRLDGGYGLNILQVGRTGFEPVTSCV